MHTLNNKMFQLLKSINWDNKLLSSNLAALLSDGFVIQGNCYFLKKLFDSQISVKKEDFIDCTGYECFINSIHIDDYVNSDFLDQAYFFLEEVFKLWNNSHNKLTLRGIISETEFGANIKFHVVRESEKWIVESEIENFEEAIIISNSN
jgi:hypothetical protein